MGVYCSPLAGDALNSLLFWGKIFLDRTKENEDFFGLYVQG
jgi:hypothetical protein